MNSNADVALSGIRRWIKETSVSNLHKSKDENIKKLVDNLKSEYGVAPRFAFTKVLKINIMFVSTNIITTAFKLTDPEIPKSEIIYGFLYTQPKEYNLVYETHTGTEKLVHQLYCASSSLLSRDGEYRQRINPVFVLTKIIDYYSDIWDDLEVYVTDKMKKYNWNTFTECFYPKDDFKKYSEELETDLVSRRFDVIMLVVCWFVEFINIAYNQKINHINKLFKTIMKFNNKPEVEQDMKFLAVIMEKYGEERVNYLYNNLNCFTSSHLVGKLSLMKLGQKIIPLNLSEIQNPFNIKYKPWREYLISEKIQSLVINNICQGVPLMGDYFYIKNTRKTLFDNYVQYMKMEHSDQAIGIARKLLEAQKGTFKPRSVNENRSSAIGRIQPKEEKLIKTYKDEDENEKSYETYEEIEEWLSNKFRVLHEKIKDPVEYAREEIIMSEIALCIISEYTGRTFYDIMNIAAVNDKVSHDIGSFYDDYDIWAKYIFELVYTLYCLNSKYGVIHGDLHLNNFTLHPLYFSNFKNVDDLKKPHMIYCLDKDHIFAFPSRQYHIVIIDFSRSIIRPSKLESFENFDLINAKKKDLKDTIILIKPEDKAEFFQEQIVRVIKFYELYFPDFTTTKKSQLYILLLNNFDMLFPIISGMDTYIVINNLMIYFKKNEYNKKYMKHFKLLEDILDFTENILVGDMEKILDDVKNISVMDIPYLNKQILDKFFKYYYILGDGKNNINEFIKNNDIIDISNYEGEVYNTLDNYNEFPDFTKYVRWYNKDGKLVSEYEKEIKEDRLKYEKLKIESLGFIANVAETYNNKIF
jgi:hypothetical protein